MNILNNDRPIGFFDSGVGGLTVMNKVKKLLPDENYIFFGDTAHVPYGEKSKKQLLEYSDAILKFFEQKHCKAVVMACNTTSSVIYDDIKDKYNFKLYPVVQSVAKVLANLNVERMGIFATKATIKSGAYEREIAKYNNNIKVYGQFCPDWVKIVENNLLENTDSISQVKSDLEKMMQNSPEKIILGCTHYPYLLGILSKFAPKEMFIDPAEPFAQFIKEDLTSCGLVRNKSDKKYEEFYTSANPKQFRESAKLFYKLDKAPELIKFSTSS